MKKHGYIAGALFNEGEIAQRIRESIKRKNARSRLV